MDIDKLSEKITSAFEKKDKVVSHTKDVEFAKSLLTKPDLVKMISEMSCKEIHKCFRGVGYKGTVRDLVLLLNEVGVRKIKKVESLENVDNYPKCKNMTEKGECGGKIISVTTYCMGYVAKSSLGYKLRKDFMEDLKKDKNKNAIIYKVNLILKSYGVNIFRMCMKCYSVFEVKKEKSGKSNKLVFILRDDMKDKIKTCNAEINEKVLAVLNEFGYKSLNKGSSSQA